MNGGTCECSAGWESGRMREYLVGEESVKVGQKPSGQKTDGHSEEDSLRGLRYEGSDDVDTSSGSERTSKG